jgi:hypothetical protein
VSDLLERLRSWVVHTYGDAAEEIDAFDQRLIEAESELVNLDRRMTRVEKKSSIPKEDST